MNRSRRATLVTAAALAALAAACAGEPRQAGPEVTVQPPSATVAPLGSVGFAALVGGAPAPAVSWSIRQGAAGGTISTGGLYTAPPPGTDPSPRLYQVVATESASGASGEAAVTVVAPSGPPVVTVQPAAVTIAPASTISFQGLVGGSPSASLGWSVRQGPAGGAITAAGLYTAPAATGAYQVIATDPGSAATGEATVTVAVPACWAAPAVNRVRLFPRPGHEAAMVGGRIEGSNTGPTSGFVTLHTIAAPPPAGWSEVSFANSSRFRWVQYYAPGATTGSVAEVEFYEGTTRATGGGYGTVSTAGHEFGKALDGDPATYYEGASAGSNYLGLDVAAGHLVATPVISPAGGIVPQTVTLTTATPGATIRYTTDGSDPAGGAVYAGPFTVSAQATVRAVATAPCLWRSAEAAQLFTSSATTGIASLHIGNSLTDSVAEDLDLMASAGGVNLAFARYTVPGAGTWVYEIEPTGGNWTGGSGSVITWNQTHAIDHITMQPARNNPCLPYGSAYDAQPANKRSDAANERRVWDDQAATNPNVQMWVYSTWKAWAPALWGTTSDDCMVGGRAYFPDESIWSPARHVPSDISFPLSWKQANLLVDRWCELTRSALAAARPERKAPWVIPGGRALNALYDAVIAGRIPGVAASDAGFQAFAFSGGTTDPSNDHLTAIGKHYVSLVFYAAMFQRDPRALPDTAMGGGAAGSSYAAGVYAALQAVAYETVSGYALSGWSR